MPAYSTELSVITFLLYSPTEVIFFQNFTHKYVNYYCDICDKTTKTESKSKHPKIQTQNELEKCIQTKHIIEKSNFFDLVENIQQIYH